MDGVVLNISSNKASEATAKTGKTSYSGIDTHAHGDDTKHDEGKGHGQRCFVRSVVSREFLVLRSPEDAVIQTEHVERCHGCNTSHDPSHNRTVLKASGDDLVLRADA